jgi:hypothetical protein
VSCVVHVTLSVQEVQIEKKNTNDSGFILLLYGKPYCFDTISTEDLVVAAATKFLVLYIFDKEV